MFALAVNRTAHTGGSPPLHDLEGACPSVPNIEPGWWRASRQAIVLFVDPTEPSRVGIFGVLLEVEPPADFG
jgi:hypothetical protein